MKMKMWVADRGHRNLLVSPDWLALVALEETEELHKTILPEMFNQIVDEARTWLPQRTSPRRRGPCSFLFCE